MAMTVCQTCGDRGEARLLIYCIKCNDCAVHHYCLDKFSPDDENIIWKCEECDQTTVSKVSPSRKSERITERKGQAFNARIGIKKKISKKRSFTADLVDIKEEMTEHSSLTNDDSLLEKRYSTEDLVDVKENMAEKPAFTRDCYPPKKRYSMADHLAEKEDLDEKYALTNESNDYTILERTSSTEDCVDVKETMARKTDLENDYSLPLLCPYSELNTSFYAAQPVANPIWRGTFMVSKCEDENLRITAHVSSKACQKVFEAASALPIVVDIDVLHRCDAWPISFQRSPPKDDSIALFLFPEYERDGKVFDALLEYVNKNDLALKTTINNVDLLIFSSLELPRQHWRFRRKYYLWGVFRKSSV